MEIIGLITATIALFTPIVTLACEGIARNVQETKTLKKQKEEILKNVISIVRLLPVETRKKDCDFDKIKLGLDEIVKKLQSNFEEDIVDTFEIDNINIMWAIRYKTPIEDLMAETFIEKFTEVCKKFNYNV